MTERFFELTEPLLANDRTEVGTMMGHACLRVRGEFFALVSRKGKLIVKTTNRHVTGLIQEGVGEPFSKGAECLRSGSRSSATIRPCGPTRSRRHTLKH